MPKWQINQRNSFFLSTAVPQSQKSSVAAFVFKRAISSGKTTSVVIRSRDQPDEFILILRLCNLHVILVKNPN